MKIFHFFCFLFLDVACATPLTEKATQFYEQGLQASSFAEQEQAFNQALNFFEEALQQAPFSSSLSRLVGDCYFQLGEYAWAILYYQRALKLNAQDSLASAHRMQAQKTLGLSSSSSSFFKEGGILHFLISPTKRLSFLFWLSLISLLGACFLLIFPTTKTKKLIFTFWGLTFMVWVVSLLAYFFTPIEAILIQPSGLYSAPSSQAQLLADPLFAGSQVQVLQANTTGDWIKIQTSNGKIGYLPYYSIRLI
jgi:tetratricopeptide (TPR) repeat protein